MAQDRQANPKRFNFADIKKGLRYERSEDNFVWLASAGVALPVYNVSDIGILSDLYDYVDEG